MSSLQGAHALITGGGSGIGLACAVAMAEDGARVTIVSSDKDLMQLVRPGVAMLDGMKSKAIGRVDSDRSRAI